MFCGPRNQVLVGLSHEDECIGKLRHLIEMELHSHRAKIKKYHAEGGVELTSKQGLALMKREEARYTLNPGDTPELKSTSERKFCTSDT